MKIIFYGDSITDMGRHRNEITGEAENPAFKYGVGYTNVIAGELSFRYPNEYDLLNRGISGNRTVDLYARIKKDVWNHQPDVLNILVGVNDVLTPIDTGDGLDIERFEKMYRRIIEDTKARLPDLKIILCEPFMLADCPALTAEDKMKWEGNPGVLDYAKVVKRLAEEYQLYFLPLQEKFTEAAKNYKPEHYLFDGIHPALAGAKLIATEWLKLFEEKIKK